MRMSPCPLALLVFSNRDRLFDFKIGVGVRILSRNLTAIYETIAIQIRFYRYVRGCPNRPIACSWVWQVERGIIVPGPPFADSEPVAVGSGFR